MVDGRGGAGDRRDEQRHVLSDRAVRRQKAGRNQHCRRQDDRLHPRVGGFQAGGKGEAEALLLVANATAESIKVVASAIQSEGGLTAVNLKVAERFVDAFGNIAKQGNTMILPGNAADFAGMVATAMQVVKKS
jgi:regulator of protease activity HflC (stomatin/prohibitin superfamily)